MNRRTATALTGLVTVAALMLTACTPTEPEPTDTPTASATPTTTPSAGPPTQEPISGPTSAAEAVSAANDAYVGFLNAQFDLMKNPQLGTEYITGFVLEGSPAWTLMQDTIRVNEEEGITVAGEPTKWSVNDSLSYTAPSTNPQSGETLEFGQVVLYGCADNSGIEFTGTDIPKGSFPYSAQMVFYADEGVWLVTDEEYLTGDGAPLC